MGWSLLGKEEEQRAYRLEKGREKRRGKRKGGRGRRGRTGRRVGWGPHTHVGEEEQDPGEERDDLPGQPQVVHGGAVRVRRLGAGTQVLTGPPTSRPRSRSSLNGPTSDPREPPPSSPRWVREAPLHPAPQSPLVPPRVRLGPAVPPPRPAPPAATHGALQRLVVGGEGEDDHGAQVGGHVDVEGHGPELAPLVPQQLVDGLHGQHLVAVLRGGAGRGCQAAARAGRLRPPTLPAPSPPHPALAILKAPRGGGGVGLALTPGLSTGSAPLACAARSRLRPERRAVLTSIEPRAGGGTELVAKYKSLRFHLRIPTQEAGLGDPAQGH